MRSFIFLKSFCCLRFSPRGKHRPLGTALASLGPADSDSTVGMRGGGSGGGRKGGGMVPASAATGTTGGVDRERSRRVRREMMDMMKNPHEVHSLYCIVLYCIAVQYINISSRSPR